MIIFSKSSSKCLSCDKMLSAVLEMLFSKVNLQEISGIEMSESTHAEGRTKVQRCIFHCIHWYMYHCTYNSRGCRWDSYVWSVFNAHVTRSTTAKPLNLHGLDSGIIGLTSLSKFTSKSPYLHISILNLPWDKPGHGINHDNNKSSNQISERIMRFLSIHSNKLNHH